MAAAPALLDRTKTPAAARVGARAARRVADSASEPLTVAARLVADRRSQAPAGTAAAAAAAVRVREPDAGAGARARARRRRKRARSSRPPLTVPERPGQSGPTGRASRTRGGRD